MYRNKFSVVFYHVQEPNKMRLRRAGFVLLLAVFSLSAAHSIHLESIDVKAGMIFIGNSPVDVDEKDAAPSPLTSILGVSFPIRFTSFFSLAPELRYFGVPYGVEYGRPVPVEVEFAQWSWVMGFLLEPRAYFSFPVAESFSIGAYVSPTFLFRIPAKTWGGASPTLIAAYQYGKGRFFYPEVGITLDWRIPYQRRSEEAEALNDGKFKDIEPYGGIAIHLFVDLGVYFPLFHAWDGEGLRFYDQLMATGLVGLRFFLPTD